jgi:hypothetical protein
VSNFENNHHYISIQITCFNGKCGSALGCLVILYSIDMAHYFLRLMLLITAGEQDVPLCFIIQTDNTGIG